MERSTRISRGGVAAARRGRPGSRRLTGSIRRLAAAGLLSALAGCTGVADVAPSPGDADPLRTSAAPVTPSLRTPWGPSTSAGSAAAVVDVPTTAPAAFELLNTYWRQAYPAAFGTSFVELAGGSQPVDSGAGTVAALCISNPASIAGNAFYCVEGDGIVYDTAVLVPALLHHYGPPGLASSLAHEFGHAVAARIGVAAGPPLVRELQADCFAGAFLRWLGSGDAPITLTGEQVAGGLAPLLDFADQVSAKPTDATAHGLAVDRAAALRRGYAAGPVGCRDFRLDSIPVALGRFDPPTDRTPRFASNAAIFDAARSSASAALGVELAPVPPSDADVAVATSYGDFALATAAVLASVQSAGRSPIEASCLAGRWAAAVFGPGHPADLGGRLWDPDQALNMIRGRPGVTADEVFAFVDGFSGAC